MNETKWYFIEIIYCHHIVTIQILPAYDLYLFNQAISGQEIAAESAYAKLCADVCKFLKNVANLLPPECLSFEISKS